MLFPVDHKDQQTAEKRQQRDRLRHAQRGSRDVQAVRAQSFNPEPSQTVPDEIAEQHLTTVFAVPAP